MLFFIVCNKIGKQRTTRYSYDSSFVCFCSSVSLSVCVCECVIHFLRISIGSITNWAHYRCMNFPSLSYEKSTCFNNSTYKSSFVYTPFQFNYFFLSVSLSSLLFIIIIISFNIDFCLLSFHSTNTLAHRYTDTSTNMLTTKEYIFKLFTIESCQRYATYARENRLQII